MRQLLIAALAALVLAAAVPADQQPAGARKKQFLDLNPDYAKRSGKFYEESYLPGAAASLARAVQSDRLPNAVARALLTGLIYDFLGEYVEGGGQMSRSEQAKVIERLDKRVRETLKDRAAFARYLKWRKETPRTENPLQFLFHMDLPFTPTLPGALTDAGWTAEVVSDLAALERYTAYFGFPPDVVVRYENRQVSRKTDGAAAHPQLMLVVYPGGRLRDALAGRKAPFGPRAPAAGKTLPPLDLFWETYHHVYLSAEGAFPEEQRRLASAVKGQFMSR
jgi:hypothetical protein